jgi:hypothetical protein
MTEHVQDTAERRAPDGHFSEGLDDRRRFPEDERVGRFSKGQERLALDEEKDRQGASAWGRRRSPRTIRRSTSSAASARASSASPSARASSARPHDDAGARPHRRAPARTGQRHGDGGGCAHLERYYREARLDDPPGDASCHSVPLPRGRPRDYRVVRMLTPPVAPPRRAPNAGGRRPVGRRPVGTHPRWVSPPNRGGPRTHHDVARAGRPRHTDCRYADSVRQTTVLRPSVALALQMARKNTTTPAISTFQAACCDSASVNAETNSHAPISALIQLRMLATHAPATRRAASTVTIAPHTTGFHAESSGR